MIVLDTHAFVWWVSNPERMSRPALRAVRKASRIGVCAISCFEVASLVARGRIVLDRDPLGWLEQALDTSSVDLLPLTPAVSVRASQLPTLSDPADRIIVATTLLASARLVTRDKAIQDLGVVETVW